MGAFTGAKSSVSPGHPHSRQADHQRRPAVRRRGEQEIYDTYMDQGGPEYMVEFPHGYTHSA